MFHVSGVDWAQFAKRRRPQLHQVFIWGILQGSEREIFLVVCRNSTAFGSASANRVISRWRAYSKMYIMIFAYKKANRWKKSAFFSLSRVKILINWCIRSLVIHFEQRVHRCHLGSQQFGHFFFFSQQVTSARSRKSLQECLCVCVFGGSAVV